MIDSASAASLLRLGIREGQAARLASTRFGLISIRRSAAAEHERLHHHSEGRGGQIVVGHTLDRTEDRLYICMKLSFFSRHDVKSRAYTGRRMRRTGCRPGRAVVRRRKATSRRDGGRGACHAGAVIAEGRDRRDPSCPRDLCMTFWRGV